MVHFILSLMFAGGDYLSNPIPLLPEASAAFVYKEVKRPHYSFVFPGYILVGPVAEAVDNYTSSLLEKELRILPPGLLKYAGVREIVGCSGLYSAGMQSCLESAGGLFKPLSNQIYLDTSFGGEFLLGTLHHELYHSIDYHQGLFIYDSEWSSFNETGFRYKRVDPLNRVDQPPLGFVSNYATSKESEDKAETFETMIREPKRLAQMVSKDQILDRKVNCLKKRLRSICQEVNEAFWERISKRGDEQLPPVSLAVQDDKELSPFMIELLSISKLYMKYQNQDRLPPMKFDAEPEANTLSPFMHDLLSISKLYSESVQPKTRAAERTLLNRPK